MNAETDRLPEATILKWYKEYAGNENNEQNVYCTFGSYAQQKFCEMNCSQENVAEHIGSCRLNLILATENEEYQVFNSVSEFYLRAMPEDMAEWSQEEFDELADNALTYLIHQQGYTVEEVFRICSIRETDSDFVGTLIDEMDRAGDTMTQLVVLGNASGQEMLDLLDRIARKDGNLEISAETTVGLFDSWMNEISGMEIQLERNLIIPADMVQNLQIEGAGGENRNVTVCEAYGLRDSAWYNGSIAVTDKEPELVAEDMSALREKIAKKSSKIQSAERG